MNQEIEAGLLAYFEAETDFDALALRVGTSGATAPDDAPVLIITCDDSENVVGPLHLARLRFELRSPALCTSTEASGILAAHVATMALVLGVLTTDTAGLTSAFATATAHRLAGLKMGTTRDTQENERWVSTIDVLAGIERDGS